MRPQSAGALVSAVVFILAATAYGALGIAVSSVPPRGIDAAARAVAGEAPAVAWVFTASCLWPVLTTLGLVGCGIAIRAPSWRARIVFAIVTTLAGWQTSNILKDHFARPRPPYWILHRETTYAYSSGHAMFAVVVYWLWAYFVARSPAPAVSRVVLSASLAAWGAAVIWSRLALGAHYPSDLAGGVLLGIAMLALVNTLASIIAPRERIFSPSCSDGVAPSSLPDSMRMVGLGRRVAQVLQRLVRTWRGSERWRPS